MKLTGSREAGVTWQTIYDVRNEMFHDLKATFVTGFWMPIVALFSWFPPRWLQSAMAKSYMLKSRVELGGKYFLPAIMIFLLCLGAKAQYDDTKLAARIDAGEVTTIEGRVEHFLPMRSRDSGPEMFDVNGVHFSYSGGGRHFARVHYRGGPIAEGEYVRIGYIGNDILHLEIAQP